MIIEKNPIILFNDTVERKDGISAFMRIKNGEDYLEATILSIIDQVDEIICVFNNSIDNTEIILVELEKKYPEKVKVYKYIPIVHPPNSSDYLKAPSDSVHSLVYYYNFALSKTTKKYCIKVDDDELFFPKTLSNIKDFIRNSGDIFCIGIRGINLFDFKNKLYINLNDECTGGYDTLLFKYDNNCRFYKTENYEMFKHPHVEKIEFAFFHNKRCKKDRGINNYLLNENPNSRYNMMTVDFFKNIKLIDIDIYLENKLFIHPINLKFKFINNSKKKYDLDLLNTLENEIKIS